MTLDEYITEATNRLAIFIKAYQAGMKDDPTNFPVHLEPGEWDEQLALFIHPEDTA